MAAAHRLNDNGEAQVGNDVAHCVDQVRRRRQLLTPAHHAHLSRGMPIAEVRQRQATTLREALRMLGTMDAGDALFPSTPLQ